MINAFDSCIFLFLSFFFFFSRSFTLMCHVVTLVMIILHVFSGETLSQWVTERERVTRYFYLLSLCVCMCKCVSSLVSLVCSWAECSKVHSRTNSPSLPLFSFLSLSLTHSPCGCKSAHAVQDCSHEKRSTIPIYCPHAHGDLFWSKFILLAFSTIFNTSHTSALFFFPLYLVYFTIFLVTFLYHTLNLEHQSILSLIVESMHRTLSFLLILNPLRRDASSRSRGYILTSVNASAKSSRVDALSLEPPIPLTRAFFLLLLRSRREHQWYWRRWIFFPPGS